MVNAFRLSMISAFVFALALAGVFACGGDDDDSGQDDAGDTADDDTGDCGSADFLPGIWTAGQITMEIFNDLTYHTVGSSQMNYDVNGMIVVDGCTAMFTDTSGQGACPATQTGQYGFDVDETALAMTLISDPCAGRVVGLDGTVFQRQS